MINGELIVDNFAGGGGASTGIEMATGVSVDIAVNHDPEAIRMHKTNHPNTKHYCESVWNVDPVKACNGNPVALAWFSPDCFGKGTLILTKTGYKPIEEISEGEYVLTHKMRWRKVTATMQSQRDEIIIKGYGHPGIVCSTGHPFYTKTRREVWNNKKRNYDHTYSEAKWKKAKELNDMDYWGAPVKCEQIPIPQMEKPNGKTVVLPIDERLLWLAGRYVGDGWSRLTVTRAEVVIVCGKKDIEFLKTKLDMWKRTGKRCRDGELSWAFRNVRTGGQFTCNSRSLAKWLRNEFGHLANEKKIPAWLFGAPIELKNAFMDGYISSDGHISGTIVEATTISKKLAYGLRTLAVTMGYSAMVYYTEGNGKIIEGREVNVKPIYKIKWREEIDSKHKQTFTEDDILWSPIRGTAETGKTKTFYNISVDEDESYIAEGIIVHNCKHFSKAKGGKPKDKNIRGLAWVALRWAGKVRPRVIMLENVEEFKTWGPLNRGHRPIKAKQGVTFRKFVSQLEGLGYQVEHRELVAADYGAPTMRKRFFLIARCDSRPIVWPEPTYAPEDSPEVAARLRKPYIGAYTQIDFSLPCPSIFDTADEIKAKYGIRAVRPLAEKTMDRIARGIKKFVLDNPDPFIVNSDEETIAPALIQYHSETTQNEVRGQGILKPIMTVDGSNRYGLVTSFLHKYYDGGYKGAGDDIKNPLPTVTAVDHNSLCAATLIQLNNHCDGRDISEPLPTITAGDGHFGEVRAFLIKYYGQGTGQDIKQPLGTVTAQDRFGLVTIRGVDYQIVDIGLRMLEPKELYGCQGFPDDYIIDRDYTWKTYPRSEQVKRCGNAVCPPIPAALVRANLPELCLSERKPNPRILEDDVGQLKFV